MVLATCSNDVFPTQVQSVITAMRVIVLGAAGLIGHKLYRNLQERFDVFATLHGKREAAGAASLFESDRVIESVEALEFEKLTGILHATGADVILNCVGITKRRPKINEPCHAIGVNALFPHRLAKWAGEHGKRVIHFSTDCVFDGAIGDYTEESPTTGPDAYGKTKALGEIRYDHTLTIRSSFIGRELSEFSELLEWFLSQEGKTIKGFKEAYYSGVSTTFMTNVVAEIIENHPDLNGLYQLSIDNPISKFDLLSVARDAFNANIEIVPDSEFVTRPTLCGKKLKEKIGLTVPSWKEMMSELATDSFYESELRK